MADSPKIVVFAGGGIGDALFHVGHFQALAKRGGGRISLACKKGEALTGLFGEIDFVERVIGLANDEKKEGRITFEVAAPKLRGFDEIWCFHKTTTVPLTAAIIGIPRRYGFYSGASLTRFLYTHAVETPRDVPYPPLASRTDLLLRAEGVPFDTASARLAPNAANAREAEAIMPERRCVALGVNASVPTKQWGGARYGALAKELAARGVERFLLFGADDVADVARETIAASGLPAERFVDLTSRQTRLAMSHALLSRCAFYVGNDSSGLNLSAFSGLPAIGLYGVTDPLHYSPLLRAVTGAGMDGISVASALQACEQVMADAAT